MAHIGNQNIWPIGTRVKYTSGKWGDNENNPLWSGAHGCVVGTVVEYRMAAGEFQFNSINTFVVWDNDDRRNVRAYIMHRDLERVDGSSPKKLKKIGSFQEYVTQKERT